MIKNFLKIAIVFLTLSLLTACSSGQLTDLSAFINTYNELSNDRTLSFESFSRQEVNGEKSYHSFFSAGDSSIMLELTAEADNIIYEMKLYMPKTDSKGTAFEPGQEMINVFTEECLSCISAYTLFDYGTAEEIMKQLLLFDKSSYLNTGELTMSKDNFYFVYYSTELACELIITNTFLKETETTYKPESRPDYGSTTNIRTETVPHE